MKRYKGVQQREIFESWDSLRNALLAAQDGHEVDEIMNFLFTEEEKFQLGRRIIIAGFLEFDTTIEEIAVTLRVGKNTILSVYKKLQQNPNGYELIKRREGKIQREYENRQYRKVGGSTLWNKRKEYTGIKRSDIKR